VDVGDGTSKVAILPFFTRQQLGNAQAATLFRQLATAATPGINWQQPSAAARGALRAEGMAPGRRAIGLLTWVNTASGTAGYLYTGNTRQEDYSRLSDTFAEVFQSFRVQGQPAAQAQGASPQYVSWRDPKEGAFTAEIPKGWSAQGGTSRPSLSQVWQRLEVTSPDGAITMYVGDDFPAYREPDSGPPWAATATVPASKHRTVAAS
jgi:hypothetical protein